MSPNADEGCQSGAWRVSMLEVRGGSMIVIIVIITAIIVMMMTVMTIVRGVSGDDVT